MEAAKTFHQQRGFLTAEIQRHEMLYAQAQIDFTNICKTAGLIESDETYLIVDTSYIHLGHVFLKTPDLSPEPSGVARKDLN